MVRTVTDNMKNSRVLDQAKIEKVATV